MPVFRLRLFIYFSITAVFITVILLWIPSDFTQEAQKNVFLQTHESPEAISTDFELTADDLKFDNEVPERLPNFEWVTDSAVTTTPLKLNKLIHKYDVPSTARVQTMFMNLDTEQPEFTCLRPNPPILPYHLCVYEREVDSYISASILSTGYWEGGLAYAITEALKAYPNSGFIDIGAYIGTHSLFVANKGYQVVAVEPFEDNLFLINRSIELNDWKIVKVIPQCLSDSTKTELFIRPDNNPGNAKLIGPKDPKNLKTFQFNCLSPNDLLKHIPFKKAVMKVDIEGGELTAFQEKSADDFFRAIDIPVVFMEWGSLLKSGSDTDIARLVQFFMSRNYQPFVMIKTGLRSLLKDPWNKWPWDIVWLLNGVDNKFAKTWKP